MQQAIIWTDEDYFTDGYMHHSASISLDDYVDKLIHDPHDLKLFHKKYLTGIPPITASAIITPKEDPDEPWSPNSHSLNGFLYHDELQYY